MDTKDLVGNYTITGTNQDSESTKYTGILNLKLDLNNKIIAEWTINKTQKQYGTGFFSNNILVINFNYIGSDLKIYKGVVVYQVLNKSTLSGFWSEKYGNQQFLGKELAVRENNLNYTSEIGIC